MTIVITGVGGFRNRGVEAFTLPTVEHLRKDFPDEEIAILTPMPDYDSQRLNLPGVRLVRNDFSLGSGSPQVQRLRRTASRLLGREPSSDRNAANRLLRSACMVIALGGDTFSSDYGQLERHLEPLAYAQQHGVPVVFLAHSIGPFRTEAEAEAWSVVARKAALITVRESLTYKYVVETLKIPVEHVRLTTDPAFLLEPPSPAIMATLLKSYAVDNKPCVALAISRNISSWRQLAQQSHIQTWQRVIETLLQLADVQILLIPHVQETFAASDDRIVATDLLRRFDYDPRLRLIGGDHSASEFKGLIGSCELVIAERMHGAIAGLSSGICTIAVGYSVKAEGIMTDLLGTDELKTGVLISVEDFVSDKTAERVVRNVWQARERIQQQLAAALPDARACALENYALIKRL